jgi:hypothetical protein
VKKVYEKSITERHPIKVMAKRMYVHDFGDRAFRTWPNKIRKIVLELQAAGVGKR